MDFSILARKLMGLTPPPSGEPDAYSRITRTPINISNDIPPGMAGLYYPKLDRMQVGTDYAQPGRGTIPHESAHAIFQRAGLESMSPELAEHAPTRTQAIINLNKATYPNPSMETLANEGLGYSIGEDDGTDYVQYAASKIQNPQLRQMLMRLHQNRMAAVKMGGLGTR